MSDYLVKLKICKKCLINQTIDNFYKKSQQGLFNVCKVCWKIKSMEYSKNNPLVIKNIRIKYNKKNKLKIQEYAKNYNSKPVQKKFYDKNKHKFFKYKKEKRKTDINFKLKENIRHIIYSNIKKGKINKIKYLGCNIDDYKIYIESLFTPEMNWDNYGSYWEIDHIKQLFSFDFSQEENIYIAFNYKNTRPLTIFENQSRPKTKITNE